MTDMVILFIEDERKLVSAVKKNLEIEGYIVDVAYNGEAGLRKGLQKEYDLIILDLMLPKKDGISVCRELRKRQVHTPVIMLTARDGIGDRIQGLDSGADDYLVKPFDFGELLARIRSLLRRKSVAKSSKLKVASLELDPVTHEVRRAGKLIPLTHTEYNFLEYLMRYPNQVLTRTKLMEHIWKYGYSSKSNSVDVYIRFLRRKIDDGNTKKMIRTVRGTGYKIKG